MKKQILYSIAILVIGIALGLFLNREESVKSANIALPASVKTNKFDQGKVSHSNNSPKVELTAVKTTLNNKTPELQETINSPTQSPEALTQTNDDYWAKPEDVQTVSHSNTENLTKTNIGGAESNYTIVSHPATTMTTQTYLIDLPPKEYVTTSSGYEYSTGGRAVDGGPINPHWTMGSNGLLQNPNVDPPSCRNRETPHLQ